jgi:hypothetical protein
MWIRWRSPKRSHAPDYFVRRSDGSALLVDVKPVELIKPEDSIKFELTRRLAAALGWSYLVFDQLPGATQANLRFLLRYRDPAWLEGVDIAELRLTGRMSLGSLAAALGGVARSGVGAAYALVWSGVAGRICASLVDDDRRRSGGRIMSIHPGDIIRWQGGAIRSSRSDPPT